MKKYTKDEKLNLLNALDLQIDNLERAKNLFAPEAKNEILIKVSGLQDLRIKLILDIAPIQTKEAVDLFKIPCILCGKSTRGDSPEWAFVDNKKICHECFEKYEPELYLKTSENNKQYWMKEEPEWYNPDGTYKLGTFENPLPYDPAHDDGLPFNKLPGF